MAATSQVMSIGRQEVVSADEFFLLFPFSLFLSCTTSLHHQHYQNRMASLKAALPLLAGLVAAQTVNLTCPDYYDYALEPHGPYSGGIYNLSYQRPVERCRTFNSSVVEKTIDRVSGNIADIDLRRLFVNTYPNTLDTAIKWRGYANNDSAAGEELTFIITGELKVLHVRIRMLTV